MAPGEVEAGGVRSVVAKLTDQEPLPVTKPRMDGSRRSDEIEAALAAQLETEFDLRRLSGEMTVAQESQDV